MPYQPPDPVPLRLQARLTAGTLAASLLAGRAVQPPYAITLTEAPAAWLAPTLPSHPAAAGAPWWTRLHGAAISTLLRDALASRPTLAQAGASINKACAGVRAVAGAKRRLRPFSLLSQPVRIHP